MSVIKLKAKISEKKQKEKLSDEKLSDTSGGVIYLSPEECVGGEYFNIYPYTLAPAAGGAKKLCYSKIGANYPPFAVRKGNIKDQRLGRLIGYCADCKCPVYSVTRKNHAGHNVITGAGR